MDEFTVFLIVFFGALVSFRLGMIMERDDCANGEYFAYQKSVYKCVKIEEEKK
jgi:hypothetical protein